MSPYQLKPDPLGVPRNPLAMYLLGLALVSGIITAYPSEEGASGAISTLPSIMSNLWGVVLAGGSAATLVGMFWQGAITTGLLLKRVGMFALAVASFCYALVVAVNVGLSGLFSSGSILGFGFACAWQYRALNARVKFIIRATAEARAKERP